MNHHANPSFWKNFYSLPLKIQELAERNFQLLKENPRYHRWNPYYIVGSIPFYLNFSLDGCIMISLGKSRNLSRRLVSFSRSMYHVDMEKETLEQRIVDFIESLVNRAKTTNITNSETTHEFLQLSWSGDESAEALISDLQADRKNSKRFDHHNDLFD